MAEHIASYTKPPVQVPETFVTVRNRVISPRKRVSPGIINHHTAEKSRSLNDQESDAQHSYFVDILERVQHTLQHRMWQGPEKGGDRTKASSSKDNSEFDLVNMFDGLYVEEPSELQTHDDSSPGQTSRSTTPKQGVAYEAEDAKGSDFYEALFAFICLLHDLRQISVAVAETWTSYKNGECDLVSASLTSNAAVELARRLEEDMPRGYAAYGGFEVLLNDSHKSYCYYLKHLLGDQEVPNSNFDSAIDDLRPSWYFWSSYKILTASLAFVRKPSQESDTEPDYWQRFLRYCILMPPGRYNLTEMLSDFDKLAS